MGVYVCVVLVCVYVGFVMCGCFGNMFACNYCVFCTVFLYCFFYVHIHTHIHTYIPIHIYIHTYIHIYIYSNLLCSY